MENDICPTTHEIIQHNLEVARQQAGFLSKQQASRELSLAITKIEEAELWMTRVNDIQAQMRDLKSN